MRIGHNQLFLLQHVRPHLGLYWSMQRCVSRNCVFVQRGIKTVKLLHMSGGVYLHIDTVVILIGDVITTNYYMDSSRNEGVLSFELIYEKLRYSNFTITSVRGG